MCSVSSTNMQTYKPAKRVTFAIDLEEERRSKQLHESLLQCTVHQELLQHRCHHFAEFIRSGYKVLYDLKKGKDSFLLDFYGKEEMKKSCEKYKTVVCNVISDTMMEILEDTYTAPDYYDEHDSCAIAFVKYDVRVNNELPFVP